MPWSEFADVRPRDDTVFQFEQRLDREHLSEQSASTSDASALDEVFERVEHRDDADLGDQ